MSKEGMILMDNIVSEFLRNLSINTRKQALELIKKYCNANCDVTKEMKIISRIDDNHYYVRYNNKEYKAFSRYEHKAGETVYVTICCGNFSKMIIN